MRQHDDNIEQNISEEVPATSTANVQNTVLPLGDTKKKQNYKKDNEKNGTPKVMSFAEWIKNK